MNRVLATLFALGIPTASLAGVIPPTPRLPQAAADLLPGAKAPEAADDPVKIADRIAANTKAAGERLAGQDTGDDTRKTQEQILKDIDALLNQNPPPMSGGGGGGKSPPPDGGGQSGEKPPPDGGGQGGEKPPPDGGGQSGQKPPPSGGGQGGEQKPGEGKLSGKGQPEPKGGEDQTNGRSARKERRDQDKGGQPDKGNGPMPMGNDPGGKPPMPPGGQPGDGGGPTGPGGMGSAKGTPALPLDDAISKQVWGHLPERLRQQMSQYYKEQFMPKYSDMLRQYYSSLAEREKAPRKP